MISECYLLRGVNCKSYLYEHKQHRILWNIMMKYSVNFTPHTLWVQISPHLQGVTFGFRFDIFIDAILGYRECIFPSNRVIIKHHPLAFSW